MAQASITMNCAVSGTVFTNNLNSGLSAFNSLNSGATAPSTELVDGKLWLDTSISTYKMKLYRTVWHPLFEFTTSTAKLTVTEAATTGAATIGGALTVVGNINNTSDERVKTNLARINDAVYKVKQLSGYTYDRTDLDTVRQAGLIAQQVEEVLPEAVTQDEVSGMKSLNYNSVIALLVQAVKEQSELIEDLSRRLKDIDNVQTWK